MTNQIISQLTLRIVDATAEDAKNIVRIQRAAWLATYPNETAGITSDMIEVRFSDSADRVRKWQKTIEDPLSKMWVIKSDDGVVGFCGVLEGEKENQLASLYVAPDQQNCGIGGKLLENALAYLGKDKDVVLDVVSYNDRAIGFYKRHGFEIVSELPDQELLRIGGVKLPETRMVLKAHAG